MHFINYYEICDRVNDRLMKKKIDGNFTFFVNESPGNAGNRKPGFLFNDPRFLQLFPDISCDCFFIFHDKKNSTCARACFQHSGQSVISLGKGAFGSIEISEKLSYDIIREFILFITDFYREGKVRSVLIRHYPSLYDPVNGPVIALALSHSGYRVVAHDISHHIAITENNFDGLINKMENRKLKRCIVQNLVNRICTHEDLVKTYQAMIGFRQAKNIPVSMPVNDMVKSFTAFPENYFLFYTSSPGGEILAGTIMVRITDKILYYFSPASNPAYKKLSPMVFLISGIYEYARKNRYSFLDLGISSIDNKPQKGLIRFKEHIGGIPAGRLVFRIEF